LSRRLTLSRSQEHGTSGALDVLTFASGDNLPRAWSRSVSSSRSCPGAFVSSWLPAIRGPFQSDAVSAAQGDAR